VTLPTHAHDPNQLTRPPIYSFHPHIEPLQSVAFGTLAERVTSAGFAFISADYQLLPPATGHDIIQDISDLMVFLVGVEVAMPLSGEDVDGRGRSQQSPAQFRIDPNAIAVSGSSAGGLCAYLAAMHCTSPKPRAVLSMYGMGGNFLVSIPSPQSLLSRL
jgi:hypothetical protein